MKRLPVPVELSLQSGSVSHLGRAHTASQPAQHHCRGNCGHTLPSCLLGLLSAGKAQLPQQRENSAQSPSLVLCVMLTGDTGALLS